MIKVAVNPRHKNKMPSGLAPTDMQRWWAEFNGGFVNMKFPTSAQFIKAIVSGHAYTAQHRKYRKAANFISGQHVGLDFDTGDERSSFDALLEDDFIRGYAHFLHSTFSHTHTAPRSRVIFVLEKPLFNREKYSLLTESFARTYSDAFADSACQDPVRIYFGAEDCKVLYLGNMLSLQVAADRVVNPYKEKSNKAERHINRFFTRKSLVDDSKVYHIQQSLLNRITMSVDGEKHTTLIRVARTFGGYVAAGYFEEEEVKQLMYTAIASKPSTKDLGVAWNAIEFGVSNGVLAPLYVEEEEEDPILKQLFLQ